MKRLLLFFATCAIGLFVAAPAFAADVTLFGSATQEATGVKIVSDTSTAATTDDFGGVTIAAPAGTTVASIQHLSATFQTLAGDCGGGSPRLTLTLNGDPNTYISLYFGTPSSYTSGCAGTVTQEFVGTADACRVDLSKAGVSGGQCSTWAQAVQLLGSQTVTAVNFIVDGGWSQSGKVQTVLLTSVTLNGTTYSLAQATPPPTTGGVNPAKYCAALRTKMGSAAFNELWGTNANAKNAFGKCVSTVAHARNAGKTEQQITDAVTACTAKGLKGSALGSCVAAKDGVAATKTEAQERQDAQRSGSHGKGHGKKK
jgi:hypothetical protein